MHDTITENLTAYEQACSLCIDDMFHVAYLALVDADAAEGLVTEVCVAGTHKYGKMDDGDRIRFLLTSDLYRRCNYRLKFCTPSTDALPEPLRALTKYERLLIAMRFSSGLSSADSGHILGMTQEEYGAEISDVIKKFRFFIKK